MQDFLRIWFLAIVRPSAAFRELEEKPAPQLARMLQSKGC